MTGRNITKNAKIEFVTVMATETVGCPECFVEYEDEPERCEAANITSIS